ncbi:MAG: tocopherol cyclase family protein [Faecalibacillus sp.]
MNKILLMKNPELFQGRKQLKSHKQYFEGWYFKNTNFHEGISFIPGVNVDGKKSHAFIQIITSETSYYVKYDISDFSYQDYPFRIKIKKNIFTKKEVIIDIKDKKQKLEISGHIKYKNNLNIHSSFFQPNIMGPFSYLTFMECYHAILSMKNNIDGIIKINGHIIQFQNDKGYIEKDWGYSFPKTYIWCQGNSFLKKEACFMISIAHIPFHHLSFNGLICVFIFNGKEYRYTTYNHSKIIKYQIKNHSLDIVLKRKNEQIHIQANGNEKFMLTAPTNGQMKKKIYESLTAKITVSLIKDNDIIFHDTSQFCGLEIV